MKKNITYHHFNEIVEKAFNKDIEQSPMAQIQDKDNISTYDLVELYNSSLKSLLDRHAPLQNITFAIRQRICL